MLLEFALIRLLVLALVLWLVARFVPYGDKIVAVAVALLLLNWLGFFLWI